MLKNNKYNLLDFTKENTVVYFWIVSWVSAEELISFKDFYSIILLFRVIDLCRNYLSNKIIVLFHYEINITSL